MKDRREAQDLLLQQRRFETWNRTEHTTKDLTINTVGKKVMRTQDGALVPMSERDDQLIVETGMWRRTQKLTDEELKNRVP